MRKVVHVVVSNPVRNVNSETLNKLKLINQIILQEANLSMIRRIGMPLIGAGILPRHKKHVSMIPTRLDSN